MSKPKIERSLNIPVDLIKDLLTDSELRMVKQRFLIINLLKEGLSIRRIAAEVNVGTDTVVRVARMIERKNLKKSLGFEADKGKDKSKTAWIFGKLEE